MNCSWTGSQQRETRERKHMIVNWPIGKTSRAVLTLSLIAVFIVASSVGFAQTTPIAAQGKVKIE